MGNIISSYIFPHPPIIVPEVGKGEEKGALQTISAMESAAERIRDEKPTTIIVTTPHGPVFQDYIYMSVSNTLEGGLSGFGAGNVKLEFKNNNSLTNRIIEYGNSEGIYCGGLEDSIAMKHRISKQLDHGTLIPLYFINKLYSNFKLVHISIAGLPFQELYRFGKCISKAVNEADEKVVFIASGDLSHRLSVDGPYGYSKYGREFDSLLVDSIRTLDIEKLLSLEEEFCENAGECGLRSFLIMFGAVDGYELKPKVYSYEGPFGVGYAVAGFEVGKENKEWKILKKVQEKDRGKISVIRAKEDEYVSLARKSLEAYVNENRILKVPDGLTEDLISTKAGVFVSIKKHGQLRGCIGTTGPTRENTAEEIIHNAVSSGTRDPRFYPVEPEELDNLVYSVDVLKEPEAIESIEELDTVKYGVIVSSGKKSGLLLPNLEGVDTPEQQVSIALQKAGIKPDQPYSMERFEVIRHK